MKDDCVLIGTIYAFDNSRLEAEGIASHDGKIVYVGEA